MSESRIVAWFSCGVTSAVAARFARDKARREGRELAIAYCDTNSEHEDNRRFLDDVQDWLQHPITILKNDEFEDIWAVFSKTRYLAGINGARCTVELKKRCRFEFQRPDDVQVFGYDYGEEKRADRFRENNPEINLWTPLIDFKITKQMAANEIVRAGIEIPMMYRLGFNNANCIGCPKGQSRYWNRIREHFPEVFERMSKVERELNVAINKSYAGDGKRKRVFLDELHPDAGRDRPEPDISCGLSCGPQEEQGSLW